MSDTSSSGSGGSAASLPPARPPAPLVAPVGPDGTAASARGEPAEAMREVARDRDHLFLLHEALVDAERAASLEARLEVVVNAIRKIGFGRVLLSLRDVELNQTKLVSAGLAPEDVSELRDRPASGIVWKRRLTSLERFRVSQSYYLDASDEWIAREFHGGLPSRLAPSDDVQWNPRDALLVPLKGSDGRIIATLVLDDPADRHRPTLARVRTVELFGQQVAYMIEQAELIEIARRRADRLARLHEVGVMLARSLDEDDIVAELARQIGRVMPCDGIVIASPDVEENFVTTLFRSVRGVRRARAPQPLGHGPIGEVARTGRSVRITDYDPNKVALAAADDVVGDGGPARSVLVVPMLVGAKLLGVIGVYSAKTHQYGAEDDEVLHTMAAQTATAIINARHYAESQREQRAGEAVADVARAVGESLRLAQVLPLILRHATAMLRSEGACIGLRAGGDIHIVEASGSAEPIRGMYIPIARSVAGRALETGTTVISNDIAADAAFHGPSVDAAKMRKIIIAPMRTKQGSIGALAVINRDHDFTDADARVLHRLAEQVAVAVVNARLFEEVTKLGERHRRVVETANDAIVITDLDRRLAFANPAAEGLFGRSGDLSGVAVADLVAPEMRDEVRERERAGFEGTPQRYDAVVVRPDGERRFVAVSTAPLREGDRITGTVASLRDMTGERRAREAMSQSEARYRNLVESASDAIYTMDARGALTSANDATCALVGKKREDLLGRAAAPLIFAEDVDEAKHNFRLALAGEARRYEARVPLDSGEARLVSVTNTPIRQGTAVVGVLGVARDVTEDRARAEALERSEARYERLVESAADAIFTLDEEMRFTSVNRALEHGTGRSRDTLLGRSALEICDPRDADAMRQALAVTIAGERPRVEVRYLGPDGEPRPASLIAAPIMEHGAVVGALGIVRDVTEEKRLVEQLLQQEKLAAIGQLVSGVAHELNNPLAGMMAFSELLLGQFDPGDEKRRVLENINSEANRAAKIVRNLLTFARRHQPERQATDVNQVLLDTVELRRYALRVEQIELSVELDGSLPKTWADPFQLQQVFLALLTNAEQALEHWTGARRIGVATTLEEGRIVARIADSGPGIEPARIGQIFNPFYTTKGVGKGTGLGLSIADGIVREHAGRISVESAAGSGATFSVALPVTATPASAHPAPPPAPAVENERSRRVLVADDERAVREALQIFLRSLGHQVDVAGSGLEAIARLESRRYDAILLDLRMPDMAGGAVYDKLLRHDPEHAARIVFVTGDAFSDSARALIERSGRPYISKPFALEDVARVIFTTAA
ncbi:MAG: PAS domain S-box protein [Gemmatimonadaceae bacterium]|nr:PAS domain S-box protein [Gemmatimonadaceae bacterium]NUQ91879.1 PAS domain S-box protein [Gemmatimonadaceae bacterium]NUR20202.1 PAS domain S-box protein [Gemmatimonadaceae bacterium]NUS99285.1 PAS domain S-box protein [Gemmatimonadaceae bacterium]